MGKKRDNSAAGPTKKRKADVDEATESNLKRARHEHPTAFVQLPHSPGGRLHEAIAAKYGVSGDQLVRDDVKPKKSTRSRKKHSEPKGLAGAIEDTPNIEAVEATSSKVDDADAGTAPNGASGLEKFQDGPAIVKKRIRKRGKAGSKNKKPSSGPELEPGLESEDEAEAEVELDAEADVLQSTYGSDGAVKSPPAPPAPPVDAVEALRKQARREQKKARVAADNAAIVAVKAPTLVLAEAEEQHSGWSISASTAGRFINHDPVFVRNSSSNEEYLLAANAGELQVLSIETSLPVRTCPAADGQTVQCFALDPTGNMVKLAHSDGSMVKWNWMSDEPAERVRDPRGEPKALAWSTTDDKKEGLLFLSQKGRQFGIYRGKVALYTTQQPLHSLQVLGASEYVIAHSSSALVLGMKQDKTTADSGYIWIELAMDKGVTCAHARLVSKGTADRRDPKRRTTLSLALGGDTEGQIYLYDDIIPVFAQKGEASLPSPRILHWHREAVSAVKFSQDGNYLISGGKETVLVLWQLETGKKQFLPHLTSEIERIVVSPEGDKYAVQMGDNSIMVLSTSELKPVANFAGLQLATPVLDLSRKESQDIAVAQKKTVTAVLHPNNANQLLLAVPATQPKSNTDAAEARPFLQTFDLRTSRHVTRQALTRNNITDFNLGPEKTPVAPPDVAHLAISPNGQWLATIDEWEPPASDLEHLVRDEGGQLEEERRKRREVYLKIWRWDEGQGLWTLSTRIDAPHGRATNGAQGAGNVFELVADPSTTGFATIGEDSCVRIWKSRTRVRHGVAVKSQDDTEVVEWTCRRAVELARQAERADSPIDAAETLAAPTGARLAYSEDGSMLAASQDFGNTNEQGLVHFIDTFTGEVKASKSGLAPARFAPARLGCMGFLDRYFITISQHTVYIWDLVIDSLHQRHKLPYHGEPMLAVNQVDGTFAVAVGFGVNVYKPGATQALDKTTCEKELVAVLAGKGRRGYTLLFEDATVRTLSSTGAAAQDRMALASAEEPAVLQQAASIVGATETEATDVEMSDVLTLPAAHDHQGLILEHAEDDRPVVRPEQLANLFDMGQSFAMPPVKDMFEAVVELFGRKPLASRLVEVAA